MLSTLGIKNRLLLLATPFHDLKTYCSQPDFSSLCWRTLFMSNWQQYFIIRNGSFCLPSFLQNTICVILAIAPIFWGFFPLSAYLLFPITFSFSENNANKKNPKVKRLKGKGWKLLPKRINFFPFENMIIQLFSHFLEKTAIVFCHLNTPMDTYRNSLKIVMNVLLFLLSAKIRQGMQLQLWWHICDTEKEIF